MGKAEYGTAQKGADTKNQRPFLIPFSKMYQFGCENRQISLPDRRRRMGAGVFPCERPARQDGGAFRQNQHFSNHEKGGAGYGSFPY